MKGVKKSPGHAEKLRKIMNDRTARGENPSKGRPKSPEWKRKMVERLARDKNLGWRAKRYRGAYLRSHWEYLTARWLEKRGLEWRFEEKVYKLGRRSWHLPDFHVYLRGNLILIVEVKGFWASEKREKEVRQSMRGLPYQVWDGPTLERLGVLSQTST